MEGNIMGGENGKKEKGLSDYGIIYLSGSIDDGTSENVCKEIIEYNISGKIDHVDPSDRDYIRAKNAPMLFPGQVPGVEIHIGGWLCKQ